MYTITLHDGTKLENLELNGNNFIAKGIIEDSVFADNLATVTITNDTTTDNYTNMILVANRVENGCSWFILREKTEQEKTEEVRDQEIKELQKAITTLLTERR